MAKPSDETLICEYANGDFSAFEMLYARHKGGVYRYIKRQCRDQSLVDDLYQEVWAKVIDSAASYQQKAKFNVWLYTIARNKLIDQVRHLTLVYKVIDTSQANAERTQGNCNIDLIYDNLKSAKVIRYCVGKLPQVQLDSFLLKEEGNLAIADIAQIVGATFEATKGRLRYAYRSLRQCIEAKIGKQVA